MLIGDFDDLLSESLDGSNMKEERGQAVSGVDGRGRGRLRWPMVTPCLVCMAHQPLHLVEGGSLLVQRFHA